MPNHTHAIISFRDLGPSSDDRRGALQSAPTPSIGRLRPKPLGQVIGAYKTHTTVEINRLLNTPGEKFWQRNYYERVIRDECDYESIWHYIDTNPETWERDEEFHHA